MLLDLKFSIGTLGIGAGTFVAALYGMNLKSFIEEWDFGFPLVSLTCGIFTLIACVYGLRKLRKVQRLSMWGEGNDQTPRAGRRGKDDSALRRMLPGSDKRACVDGDVGDGGARWSDVVPYAERVERMEKTQWRTEETLRKLRLKEERAATLTT